MSSNEPERKAAPEEPLRLRVVRRIADVESADWNRLGCAPFPFLRHEFLNALEAHGCLGEDTGWLPSHLLFERGGRLVAAMPVYLKLNSFGEFVFDWVWANAYRRAGLDYYPKLVVASPFTPATGPRLLMAPQQDDSELAPKIIGMALDFARSIGVSSCHWLFATDPPLLNSPHLLLRQHYQFHWHNQGYGDFEHFLSFLTSRRRKQIRKERRDVAEAGVQLRRLYGSELTAQDWAIFHRLYCSTFDRYGNYPALTLDFFKALGRDMGRQVLIVFADHDGSTVAAAFFLVGENTLYGRYWGASVEIPALHFEVCYYQGLDFCLQHGLRRFEPGAQGEHKISRGFLPTSTWSAHWIAEPRLRSAIADFLIRETQQTRHYMAELNRHSPFKAQREDG